MYYTPQVTFYFYILTDKSLQPLKVLSKSSRKVVHTREDSRPAHDDLSHIQSLRPLEILPYSYTYTPPPYYLQYPPDLRDVREVSWWWHDEGKNVERLDRWCKVSVLLTNLFTYSLVQRGQKFGQLSKGTVVFISRFRSTAFPRINETGTTGEIRVKSGEKR